MTPPPRQPDMTDKRLEWLMLALIGVVLILDVIRWQSHVVEPMSTRLTIATTIGSLVIVSLLMFRLIRRRMLPR